MNASPQMYQENNAGAPSAVYQAASGGRPLRHYPLKVLQVMGGVAQDAPRRPRQQQRQRTHTPNDAGDNTAFGDSDDDSSLSSNASGSNKSTEKASSISSGGGGGGGACGANSSHGYREWRARTRAPQRRPDRHPRPTYAFQVKYTPDNLVNGSKWDPLSQEIWEKFIKSQQSEETFRNKMALWRYLFITIKNIFPRYGLYVVGSTMSGFGLESSDMDLCLFVRALEDLDPRPHALLHLSYILGYIKGFDPNAELIQAKVPILKFRDHQTGLQVDLNCNNVVGIRNTNLLYCYSRMDWRVRPLVAVTKLWARAHNINDARQRTLSSYSLTLMVIHFLQCGARPAVLGVAGGARRPQHNRATLGELFLQLLQYYADFPYNKLAVSVRAGRALSVAECRAARSHKNDPHQWKLICVEEPYDLTNTARSVYDPETFEKIVSTFRESAARLAATLRLAAAWPAHAVPDKR